MYIEYVKEHYKEFGEQVGLIDKVNIDESKVFQKMKGFNIDDNPMNIYKYSKYFFKEPCLLNICTNRIYWHAGAGKDSDKTFDRYEHEKTILGMKANIIDLKYNKLMKNLWQKRLEK